MRDKKESDLANVDSFVKDLAAIAYDKACETIADEITEVMRKETSQEINRLKDEINDSGNLITKTLAKFALEQLTILQQRLSSVKSRVVISLKKTFASSEKKEQLLRKISDETRPSLIEILNKKKEQIARDDAERALCAPIKKKHHDLSL